MKCNQLYAIQIIPRRRQESRFFYSLLEMYDSLCVVYVREGKLLAERDACEGVG